MALLIYQRPNLLLLDEPTNHLDLNARDALGWALQDYPGALVVVSHDRHLLRSVVDDLWLVTDGSVRSFSGDLEDYGRWLSQSRNGRESEEEIRANLSRKDQRRLGADKRRQLRPLQAAVEKAEAILNELTNRKKRLEEQLANADLYVGQVESKSCLQALLLEKADVEKKLSAMESSWLEASEALEMAQQEFYN